MAFDPPRPPRWVEAAPSDRDWFFAFEAVDARFPRQVFRLSITSNTGLVTIRGAIGSLSAKAFLLRLIRRQTGVAEVEDLLEVTAPLVPAGRRIGPAGRSNADPSPQEFS